MKKAFVCSFVVVFAVFAVPASVTHLVVSATHVHFADGVVPPPPPPPKLTRSVSASFADGVVPPPPPPKPMGLAGTYFADGVVPPPPPKPTGSLAV